MHSIAQTRRISTLYANGNFSGLVVGSGSQVFWVSAVFLLSGVLRVRVLRWDSDPVFNPHGAGHVASGKERAFPLALGVILTPTAVVVPGYCFYISTGVSASASDLAVSAGVLRFAGHAGDEGCGLTGQSSCSRRVLNFTCLRRPSFISGRQARLVSLSLMRRGQRRLERL